MIQAYITWNADPEFFSIGPLSIRWYGLLFASSFIIGYIIFQKIFKKEKLPIELLDKLTVYMALGTLIGARLGHCFFYDWAYFSQHPLEIILPFRFQPEFEFTGFQGLASHGAGIGILAAIWLYSKNTKKTFLWVIDRIVIVVALAGFFIRTGNLMNSEIYGVETNLPWGFIFIRNAETVAKHPTQLYEGLSYLLIFFVLYRLFFNNKGKLYEGKLFAIFLVFIFLARFLIEFIKEEQAEFEQGMALNMGQWLSIPFIIAGIVLWYWAAKRNKPVLVIREKIHKKK